MQILWDQEEQTNNMGGWHCKLSKWAVMRVNVYKMGNYW